MGPEEEEECLIDDNGAVRKNNLPAMGLILVDAMVVDMMLAVVMTMKDKIQADTSDISIDFWLKR